jgi:beta-glucuronidase
MTAPRRLLIVAPLVAAVLAVSEPGLAHAHGPVYQATPPTLGALYRDGQSGRYLLGGTWLYRPDPTDAGVAQGWWSDVAATDGWSPVTVPNSYNAGDFSSGSMAGYVGWYRRDFTVSSGAFAKYVRASARHWIIRFESVNYRASVWLNGRPIGTHAGAYLPFEFDLNGLRPGVNRLIVRVDDRLSPSTLPPNPGIIWWNFGGLQREVYLRAVQAADLEQVQVRPVITCPTCAAQIQEQVLVRNVTGAPQQVQLHGFYGSVPISFGSATIGPHATWRASATALVRHPRLWSPPHPTLYRATLGLSDSHGRTLGGYVTYSGIRNITVTARGRLEINWRPVSLRGVDLHEQNIQTGAALSPAQLRQLITWARATGATLLRAHYPLNPEIAEMADQAGLLLWSEVPFYHVKNPYLGSAPVQSLARAFLTQNILTNQNHPSVLLWSIGNELNTPVDGPEAAYIASAAGLAHRLDPTRPVGMAISAWPGVPCQGAYAPLDVVGFNEYFGWYDAGGGTTDDRDALSPFLDGLRACYPTKAVFVSEFGFEGNRNGPVEERGTFQFQSDAASFHLGVFASKPWLAGAIYWLVQDFAAIPGWGGGDPRPDPPFVQKGLFDLYGNAKPVFSVVSSIYHATPQFGTRRR